MYFSFFYILSFLLGKALSFSLAIGNDQIDSSDILSIPDGPVNAFCNGNCTGASARIAACDDDPTCLCSLDTVVSLLSCENCMLHFLIAQNAPAPDFRAGSNVVMGAYAAACKTQADITLPPHLTALSLPDSWNGPFVAILSPALAVVYAAFGGVLAFSALYILNVD